MSLITHLEEVLTSFKRYEQRNLEIERIGGGGGPAALLDGGG